MQPRRPDIQADRREERNFSKPRDRAQQVLDKHKERAKDANRRKNGGERGNPAGRDSEVPLRPAVMPRESAGRDSEVPLRPAVMPRESAGGGGGTPPRPYGMPNGAPQRA